MFCPQLQQEKQSIYHIARNFRGVLIFMKSWNGPQNEIFMVLNFVTLQALWCHTIQSLTVFSLLNSLLKRLMAARTLLLLPYLATRAFSSAASVRYGPYFLVAPQLQLSSLGCWLQWEQKEGQITIAAHVDQCRFSRLDAGTETDPFSFL